MVGRLPHHFSTFPKYNGTVLFDRNVPWRLFVFCLWRFAHPPHLASSSASCFHYAPFEYRGSLIFPSFFWTVLFSHCLVTCHLLPCSAHMSSVNIPSRFLVAFLFIPPPPRKASPARSRRCIGIRPLNMAANGSAFVL